MKKNIFLLFYLFGNLQIISQNVGINATGTAPAATNLLEVLNASTVNNSVGIYALHSGIISGTGYGIWAEKTGASTTNVAAYFSASGATNNYAIIIPSPGGSVGIGDTSPDHTLDVAGNIGMDASSYINFGDTDGAAGYGIRDNGGIIEVKNSVGSWGFIEYPIASIMPYAGTTPPSDWLLCDGTAINRSTYSSLFAIITTLYGVGDGSTTFNLPDLMGRVAVGAGTGTYKSSGLYHVNGDNLQTRTLGEYKGAEYPTGYLVFLGAGNVNSALGNLRSNSGSGDLDYNSTLTTPKGLSAGNSEGGNMQPYIGLTYIIKYR